MKPIELETTTTSYSEIKTAYPGTKRIKRFIADFISLGIQGFTVFQYKQKRESIEKGNEKADGKTKQIGEQSR